MTLDDLERPKRTLAQKIVLRSPTEHQQEAHLPQRNSASAAHVYLVWLANWSCNAQNTAESQRLCYFLTFKRS